MSDDETPAPLPWPSDHGDRAAWQRFGAELPAEDLARAFRQSMDLPNRGTATKVLSRRLARVATRGGTPDEQRALAEAVDL